MLPVPDIAEYFRASGDPQEQGHLTIGFTYPHIPFPDQAKKLCFSKKADESVPFASTQKANPARMTAESSDDIRVLPSHGL